MSPENNIPPEVTVTDFVRVTLVKTRILFPDREIIAIEPMDIHKTDKDNGDFNYITKNGTKIPVYVFDEDLQLVSASDNQHKICVFLEDNQDRIGIICDEADKVTLDDVMLHELPECMLCTDAAIQNIAVSNNNLYCVSNLANLLKLIRKQDCD
jgi:hypothetical protein